MPPPLTRSQSAFSESLCRGRLCEDNCDKVFLQYAHIAAAWKLLLASESRSGVKYTHLVHARNDFTYRDAIDAAWLQYVLPTAVLIPSTEFDNRDRWWERDEQQAAISRLGYPETGLNDQLAFGRREPMRAVVELAWFDGATDGSTDDVCSNRVMARHVRAAGASVLTIELQYGTPGGDKFINGNAAYPGANGEAWVDQPCRTCWNVTATYP